MVNICVLDQRTYCSKKRFENILCRGNMMEHVAPYHQTNSTWLSDVCSSMQRQSDNKFIIITTPALHPLAHAFFDLFDHYVFITYVFQHIYLAQNDWSRCQIKFVFPTHVPFLHNHYENIFYEVDPIHEGHKKKCLLLLLIIKNYKRTFKSIVILI